MFKKSAGFSLVQVLVAAGIMGLLASQVFRIIDHQNRAMKTIESKAEEIQVFQNIQTAMSDHLMCNHTLVGTCTNKIYSSMESCTNAGHTWKDYPTGNGDSVEAIYSRNGRSTADRMFYPGQTFGPSLIKLTSFVLDTGGIKEGQANANFIVNYERKRGSSWSSMSKKIPLMLTMKVGLVVDCISSSHNNITSERILKAFESYGQNLQNNLQKSDYQDNCPDGSYVSGVRVSNGVIKLNCKDLP